MRSLKGSRIKHFYAILSSNVELWGKQKDFEFLIDTFYNLNVIFASLPLPLPSTAFRSVTDIRRRRCQVVRRKKRSNKRQKYRQVRCNRVVKISKKIPITWMSAVLGLEKTLSISSCTDPNFSTTGPIALLLRLFLAFARAKYIFKKTTLPFRWQNCNYF